MHLLHLFAFLILASAKLAMAAPTMPIDLKRTRGTSGPANEPRGDSSGAQARAPASLSTFQNLSVDDPEVEEESEGDSLPEAETQGTRSKRYWYDVSNSVESDDPIDQDDGTSKRAILEKRSSLPDPEDQCLACINGRSPGARNDARLADRKRDGNGNEIWRGPGSLVKLRAKVEEVDMFRRADNKDRGLLAQAADSSEGSDVGGESMKVCTTCVGKTWRMSMFTLEISQGMRRSKFEFSKIRRLSRRVSLVKKAR